MLKRMRVAHLASVTLVLSSLSLLVVGDLTSISGLALIQLVADRKFHSNKSGEEYDVRKAAENFNDKKCRAARTQRGKQSWKLFDGDVLETLDGVFEWNQDYIIANLGGYRDENGDWWPANDTSPYVAYVRNQKAASRYLTDEAPFIFNANPKIRLLVSYEKPKPLPTTWKVRPGEVAHINSANPIFAFSVVRDPFRAALAAYMEVTVTRASGLERPDVKPAYKEWMDWPCRTKAEATARFSAFLQIVRKYGMRDEDMARTQNHYMYNLGKDMFHIYPQALKLTVRVEGHETFEAIGRLEYFADDLRKMRKAFSGVDEEITLPVEDDHAEHSHAQEECANIDLDDSEMMKSFCDLYYVDYVCFPNYEPPPACKLMYA